MMLQEHPFFSSPSIFFGVHETINEDDDDEKEWSFSEGLRISMHANLLAHQQSRIGLFLYWIETSES